MSTLTIDWTRCVGHGVCIAAFGEQLRPDRWGYPDGVTTAGVPVPTRLEQAARDAALARRAHRDRPGLSRRRDRAVTAMAKLGKTPRPGSPDKRDRSPGRHIDRSPMVAEIARATVAEHRILVQGVRDTAGELDRRGGGTAREGH